LVETDEQLLHLTRYLHLNPTTAYLVDNPQDWPYSSYQQYINEAQPGLCKFSDLIELDNQQYRQFVADNLDYQRQLKYIKDLIIEEA
jgi:putative transposase